MLVPDKLHDVKALPLPLITTTIFVTDTMSSKNIIKNNSLILFLLLVASTLRLYNVFDLQYTYDELSAVDRLRFDSFSELITKGVMIDAHPALVQVWMYLRSIFCVL